MHFRIFAAAAVLSLGPVALAPAAAWAQSGEVEFHIEATATVAPDRAAIPLILMTNSATEEQAKAGLDKAERAVRKRLAGLGIKPAQISVVPPEPGSDGEISVNLSENCAVAAAIDASGDAAPQPNEAEGAGAAAESAHAASNAAASAASGDEAGTGCNIAYFAGRRTLKIELSDLSKLEGISAAAATDGFQIGKIVFSQSDPAAAHRKARSDAIARARLDADGWAEAMGYRITGIKRVSNTKPSVSLPGLIEFMATVEGRGPTSQPSWFAGSVSGSVMIDFIAVPK